MTKVEVDAVLPAPALTDLDDLARAGKRRAINPRIDDVEPSQSPLEGGITVVITGSFFAPNCVVRLGGRLVMTEEESITRLVVKVPPRSEPGEVDVRVTNPTGASSVHKKAFLYLGPPIILDADPSVLSTEGAPELFLRGDGFVNGCLLTLNGEAHPCEWQGPRQLKTKVGSVAAGTHHFEITNPDGQKGTFSLSTAEPPRIYSVAPDTLTLHMPSELTITGRGLSAGVRVWVGDQEVFDRTRESPTELRLRPPPAKETGQFDVKVQNRDGGSDVLAGAIRVVGPAPCITEALPATDPFSGFRVVVLLGSGFARGCRIRVGEHEVPGRFTSDERVEATIPSSVAPGIVDVAVINPDGQSHTLYRSFTHSAPPIIRAATPRSSSREGGINVEIEGECFSEPVEVYFGDVKATSTRLSATRLAALVPPLATEGTIALVVENSDGQRAELEGGFLVSKSPEIEAKGIRPNQGPLTGGTRVTVLGAHFAGRLSVYFGSNLAQDLKVVSSSELLVTTPAGSAAGLVDVVVRNGDGGTGRSLKAFQYDAPKPATLTSVSPNRVSTKGGVLTLTGSHFMPGTTVRIDGKPAVSVKWKNATTLEVTVPAGVDQKMADVAVANPGTREAVLKRVFAYDGRYR